MGSPRVKILNHQTLTQAAAQSHTAPSAAGDGVDVTSWRNGGYAPDAVDVALDGDGAIAITAGAYLAGYNASADAWRKLAELNEGAAISLTAGVGYAERFVDVGGYDELKVVDTGDTGTHTVKLTPIETLE